MEKKKKKWEGGGGEKNSNNLFQSHKGKTFFLSYFVTCKSRINTQIQTNSCHHNDICLQINMEDFLCNKSKPKMNCNCVINLIIVWQRKELGMKLELHVGQLSETGPCK